MYSDNNKKTEQLLVIAKKLAHCSSKLPINSRSHVDFMALSIDYIRDRAILRLKRADR